MIFLWLKKALAAARYSYKDFSDCGLVPAPAAHAK
jgi:hypothetical protein